MNENFTKSTRDYIRGRNEKDTLQRIESLSASMRDLGYSIHFGHIGKKTTYCMLTKGDEEIVGYTFIKDSRYNNENVGKLKALQQAVTRKEMIDSRNAEESSEN